MHRTSSVTAMFLLAVSAGLALAQDSADTRNLSVEQVTAYNAGAGKGSLRITASVDRKDLTYARGDTLKLSVKANEDAYVTVYNVGPSGQVTQLFPNKFHEDNRVKANTTVNVPGAKAQIKVSGPVGAELIKIVATSKPHKVLSAGTESGQVFVVMKGGVSDLVRNLQVTAAEPAATGVATHNLVIKTVASR
jgi:hypothetical protein